MINNIKIGLVIIVFTSLIVDKSTFAGCFPRDDIYVEVAKEPNIECISAKDIPFCGGELMISIKNNCKDTLIHKKTNTELQSGDDYETYKIPQNVGDTWEEFLYYKETPSKNIILTFKNKKIKENIIQKIKDVDSNNSEKIVGLNIYGYMLLFSFFSIAFIFTWKIIKRRKN